MKNSSVYALLLLCALLESKILLTMIIQFMPSFKLCSWKPAILIFDLLFTISYGFRSLYIVVYYRWLGTNFGLNETEGGSMLGL